MKYIFIILLVLFSIFTGFIMTSNSQDYTPSKAEQLVNETLERTARIIMKKYNIKASGSGAGMPEGCVNKLSLSFHTKNRLNIDGLRELLIKCAHELLDQINNNIELQQFLVKRPFTIENVQIIIFNKDKGGGGLVDPEIASAQISEGILDYLTIDPEDTYKFKNRYKEPYEKALQYL